MMRSNRAIFALAAVLACVLLAGSADGQTTVQAEWKERFRMHDRNSDGRIDRAEFHDWMVEAFYRRDQARKGYLVVEDVKGVMSPDRFAAANRKRDGRLSLPEFLNAVFQDFEAADLDKDGRLTMEEIEAYIGRPAK